MSKKIIILGGGLGGLYAAWRLAQRPELDFEIKVIEKASGVGGLCRSMSIEGIHFDLGSHRIHPSCRPEILNDLNHLLKDDLLLRRRRGRIFLAGRFMDFPLEFKNLLLSCPLSFKTSVLLDVLTGIIIPKCGPKETFKETMLTLMGPTVCKHFYFPLAHKMWGLAPERISYRQALVRTKSTGLKGVLTKILEDALDRTKSKGLFYYPREGMGQIAAVMARELDQLGVTTLLNADVKEIIHGRKGVQEVRLVTDAGEAVSFETDFVFSAIPLPNLMDLVRPLPLGFASNHKKFLHFRAILFLFMVLPARQITPFDAHYFPEESYCFTRISEPKNYSGALRPKDVTGLCVEIPCYQNDPIAQMGKDALEMRVRKELCRAGFQLPSKTIALCRTVVPNAYPIYVKGYEGIRDYYLKLVSDIEGLVSFGRCGLFVHDNMHHTMAMAREIERCFGPGGKWHAGRWKNCMKNFESFVVED